MIDWLGDFQEKFNKDERITNLKKGRFYGYLKINFFDGNVAMVNREETIKPTLTQGGKSENRIKS